MTALFLVLAKFSRVELCDHRCDFRDCGRACVLRAMEDLFHARPPFAFTAVGKRSLTGLAELPPFLGLRIGSHLGHVGVEIVSNIFEIAEEIQVAVREFAEVDRIIPDVAVTDHTQYLRPHGGVEAFVFVEFLGAKPDDACVSFHKGLLIGESTEQGCDVCRSDVGENRLMAR